MKISELKTLEHNPRAITQEALGKLAESIKRNSKFMPLRPIVIDDDGNVLGGNQRLRAIRDILGMDEVPDSWVVRASDLSEQERREFVLVDNVQSGDWDVELLREHWMDVDLEGLGVPFEVDEMDIIFDHGATNSNSGGHDILTSVSFWIYDHKITDSRDHVWDFVKKNKERIREANQEKVVDAILGALNEVLD